MAWTSQEEEEIEKERERCNATKCNARFHDNTWAFHSFEAVKKAILFKNNEAKWCARKRKNKIKYRPLLFLLVQRNNVTTLWISRRLSFFFRCRIFFFFIINSIESMPQFGKFWCLRIETTIHRIVFSRDTAKKLHPLSKEANYFGSSKFHSNGIKQFRS